MELHQDSSTSTAAKASFMEALRSVASAGTTAHVKIETQIDKTTFQVSRAADAKLAVPIISKRNQGSGTAALTMVMKFFGVDSADQNTNNKAIGHGPLALRDLAVSKGFVTRQKNNATIEDLTTLIDQGIPIMALGSQSASSPVSLANYVTNVPQSRWTVVTGYKKDDSGKVTQVYYNDPSSGLPQCSTVEDFKTKFWDNNCIPNAQHYFMALAPKGSFPEIAMKKAMPFNLITTQFEVVLKTIDSIEDNYYRSQTIVTA